MLATLLAGAHGDRFSDSRTASAQIVATGDTAALPLSTLNVAPPVTVTDGATAEIAGAGTQAVTFAGATGTLNLMTPRLSRAKSRD